MQVATDPHRPSWDRLFDTALAQEGHFTTEQAADAGYSSQLLNRHLRSGKIRRVRRGVYRVVHFPAGEHEDLTVLWLWTERAGVYSHETALALHDLSDLMPSRMHLTLPTAWHSRRLRVPDGVVLHYADIDEAARAWFSAVPVTAPLRTIVDCARDKISPAVLQEAIEQALERGIVSRPDLDEAASGCPEIAGALARAAAP